MMSHHLRTTISLAVLALALLVLLAVAGCRGFQQGGSTPGNHPTPGGNTTPTEICPIDGMPTTQYTIWRRPLAVMVENSPQARPQTGLGKACVVYEAITEGGITRFMAVFLHNDVDTIGPVRSVRPHFIRLAQEYDPALVHCGESYEALQILTGVPPVYNLDQLKYARPFWRDHSRKAPHNLYTSTEKLRAFMQKQEWEGSVPKLPSFVNDGVANNGTPSPQIDISFGGAVKYRLRYVYDEAAGGYKRYMDGKLHVDRITGDLIVAKNIVIQRVAAEEFATSKLKTWDVRVIGSGSGLFATGGKIQPLQWEKGYDRDFTEYKDARGGKLPFQAGQTWIELVPLNGKVTYTTSQ